MIGKRWRGLCAPWPWLARKPSTAGSIFWRQRLRRLAESSLRCEAFGSSTEAEIDRVWSRHIRPGREKGIMIKEHDRVVLTAALRAHGLEAGDVGSVVHLYEDGRAYEVEFVALDGHTAAVVTVEASQV